MGFKNIAVAALICALPSIAPAGTIPANYVGCLTKDALDEFITAANNDDTRQMNVLLNNTCFNIGGREFSVVDRGLMTSQVRVYAGSGSVVLWTITKATR